uniref:Uncharacterized protein n=1 Tax=Aegilops tauschii subsp. strangulata TaxID=200361 RepID=A0A453CSY2_AEGTS
TKKTETLSPNIPPFLQNQICVSYVTNDHTLVSNNHTLINFHGQVNGVYLLLSCHAETLLSLEFIHCQLYPAVMDKVCISLCQPGSQNYKFQSFYSALVLMLIFLPYVKFFVICRPTDNLCMFI